MNERVRYELEALGLYCRSNRIVATVGAIGGQLFSGEIQAISSDGIVIDCGDDKDPVTIGIAAVTAVIHNFVVSRALPA